MIQLKPRPGMAVSLELTPLIDIVFIVVVFLLLTANSQVLTLPVDIPSTEQSAEVSAISAPAMVITLQASRPFWGINDQEFSDWQAFKPALLAHLQAQGNSAEVSVAAAHDAEVEPLLKLLAVLNEQHVTNTQILMKEERP